MAMDQFLAQLYNTNTPVPPSAEETEKAAQVDLFVKAATANNIDLETLPRDQVETLFNSFVENLQGEKVAAAASQESAQGGEAVTEDLARQQWEEKAAAARKFAEYDFGGRVMAHAYVDEMRKIAADLQKKEEEEEEEKEKGKEKQAGRAADVALRGLGALNAGVGAVGDAARSAGGAVARAAKAEKARHHISELRRPLEEWEKKGPHRKYHGVEAAKGVAQTGALYGGGAAGVGAAGYGAHKALSKKDGEKEASAPDFDQVAAGYALDLIDAFNKEAGADAYDMGTAEQRLTAILVLGVPESTKTASASDFDTAKHIRALELLELAGYPISWGG